MPLAAGHTQKAPGSIHLSMCLLSGPYGPYWSIFQISYRLLGGVLDSKPSPGRMVDKYLGALEVEQL